jgi:hypothetical protein
MRAALAFLSLTPVLVAQAPAPTDPLAALRFLEGTWVGEGGGLPGQVAGRATFQAELGGRVLVRRGFADTAAAPGRPASRHEDLLTLYAEAGLLKAFYVDNEGHVIRYRVAAVPEGVALTSEPAPGPTFRLSYLRRPEGRVLVRFEIAPPGKPDAFSPYLEATTRRLP